MKTERRTNRRLDLGCAVLVLAAIIAVSGVCKTAKHAEGATQPTIPYIVDLNRPAVPIPTEMAGQLYHRVQCESSWNHRAINKSSGAQGLLQIMGVHWARANRLEVWDLLDPVGNVQVAVSIWLEQGWNPWRESDGCVARLAGGR